VSETGLREGEAVQLCHLETPIPFSATKVFSSRVSAIVSGVAEYLTYPVYLVDLS